ncbi:hypothetical protein KA013_01515 [Patescibacteria group bacterium]|nr:hypothetical protein [Patescibacteria group bacterium]
MTNPELQAKDHVDTKEEKLLQKEAKDTDLSAHQDLIDMIAYKYAGKAGAENKDDQDGKDLYKGDISEKDAKQVLVPFQGLAKAFGVPFVKDILSSPLYDVKYEDIVAMDKELSTSLQNREIILIQNELNALKQVIQMP